MGRCGFVGGWAQYPEAPEPAERANLRWAANLGRLSANPPLKLRAVATKSTSVAKSRKSIANRQPL